MLYFKVLPLVLALLLTQDAEARQAAAFILFGDDWAVKIAGIVAFIMDNTVTVRALACAVLCSMGIYVTIARAGVKRSLAAAPSAVVAKTTLQWNPPKPL